MLPRGSFRVCNESYVTFVSKIQRYHTKDNNVYDLEIIDMEPAGMLIRAKNIGTSKIYTTGISESDLLNSKIGRNNNDMTRLAESVDICALGSDSYVYSKLNGIERPKILPSGDAARDFIYNLVLQNGSKFTEFLTTGLLELCDAKPFGPEGIDAVRWLGNWLITNNPNTPSIKEPDE